MKRSLVLLTAVLLASCGKIEPSVNQITPTTSPSGKFIAELSIEPNKTDPKLGGSHVWKVSIFDSNHKNIYKDESSRFIATLNVYWGWDSKDRFWLYNSDDGYIWKWDFDGSSWKKQQVVNDSEEKEIPHFILPDYAKEHL